MLRPMRTPVAGMLAASLLLAGCGGGGSEADAIAREGCDLLVEINELITGDPTEESLERFEEIEQEFAEIQERADAAELSEADMEAAFQSQCPEIYDQL